VFGLSEVGIASQSDALKTGMSAEFDYAIRLGRHALVAGTVSASIDQR
jgi:hypothetical protein